MFDMLEVIHSGYFILEMLTWLTLDSKRGYNISKNRTEAGGEAAARYKIHREADCSDPP